MGEFIQQPFDSQRCAPCPKASSLRADVKRLQEQAEKSESLLAEQVVQGLARATENITSSFCTGPAPKDGSCPVSVAIGNLEKQRDDVEQMFKWMNAGLKEGPVVSQEPTTREVVGKGTVTRCWEGGRLSGHRQNIQREVDYAKTDIMAAEETGRTKQGMFSKLVSAVFEDDRRSPYEKDNQAVANGIRADMYVSGVLGACALCHGQVDNKPVGEQCPIIPQINTAMSVAYEYIHDPTSETFRTPEAS